VTDTLSGLKVAILVADGFEQVELTEPKAVLEQAGAHVHIVSPKTDAVRGWSTDRWGDDFAVDSTLTDASPSDYDALVLPGGVLNPDSLRVNAEAVNFVKHFFQERKPVAAICHGPWTLIEAGIVEGKHMTSYHSIKTDLMNAGADWIDEEVVTADGLVTSRSPDDLPAFNREMLAKFSQAEALRGPSSSGD
jgi:protease I